MTSFLRAASADQFVSMLGALSGMSDKAERYATLQSFDIGVLNAPLAPDMHHLIRLIANGQATNSCCAS